MGFFSNLLKGPEKVNEFFRGAWKSYVFLGEDEGRASAIAACIIAAKPQRDSMIKELANIGAEIESSNDSPESDRQSITAKINMLLDEINVATAHNPGISDVARAKTTLKNSYPEAEKALAMFDGDYFVNKFPQIK